MNKSVEGKKKKKPTFRGRFGTRSKRRKSIKKWDKWRVSRGIDIKWYRGDGSQPGAGYKTKKELRHLHPKGLPEMILRSKSDIERVEKNDTKKYVFRFESTIGKKKRMDLMNLAKEKGMFVANVIPLRKAKQIKGKK